MIALWSITVYLRKNGKNYLLSMLPAIVMSAVTSTYFVVAPECLGALWKAIELPYGTYYPLAIAAGVLFAGACTVLFFKMNKA